MPARHHRRGNPPPARRHPARLKPLVLLVEDYDDARDMYREFLSFSGFDVKTAENGHDALQQARACDPDIILMDLSLPVLDGWEATRRLKADDATAHLRVIALSAHAMAAEARKAREAGCDAFIAKPCLPEDLVAEIARVLHPGAPATRRRVARKLR